MITIKVIREKYFFIVANGAKMHKRERKETEKILIEE